jgi:hypothetical protein
MQRLARGNATKGDHLESVNGGQALELEVESMNSGDGDMTGHGENPTILKKSKAAKEAEMKAAYANPFKQEM